MHFIIIDRYILREVSQIWVAVTAVLVLILATNSLIHLLGKVVEGELAGGAVLPLFFVRLTAYFVTLIPLGLFLALLLGLGRLYADSEMAALGACGVGVARLFRPVVLLGSIGAVCTAALSIWASPWAERAGEQIAARVQAESEFAGLIPGRFNQVGDQGVFFAESRADDGALEEVFLAIESADAGRRIVRARRAVERRDDESGRRYIEFHDGWRSTVESGASVAQTIEFERHGIYLPRREMNVGTSGPAGMSIAELWQAGGSRHIAELQWRLSLPLACFLLALAALPLSHTTPRSGRYGKVAAGLLLYLVYSNLIVFAEKLLQDAVVPPALGLWWTHGVMLLMLILLTAHRVGWRWSWIVIRAPRKALQQ